MKKIRKFVYQSQEKHTNLCQSVTQNFEAVFFKLVSKCKIFAENSDIFWAGISHPQYSFGHISCQKIQSLAGKDLV